MEIRQFKPEDAKQYWDLRLRALEECPEAFGASYEEEKEKPLSAVEQRLKASLEKADSEFILGCFDEEQKPIGMIVLLREWREKLRHKATIYAVYVAPEARCRGVGKALLGEALRMAKNMQGLEQVNLGVMTANESAKKLYISCGFRVYGVEKNALKLHGKYLDEELMGVFL